MFEHQRQSASWSGIEGAFHHFGGRPRELLLDNAKPLVQFHDAQTREVRFNDPFHVFCPLLGRAAEGMCAVPSTHQG